MAGSGTEYDELFESWEPDDERSHFEESRIAYGGLVDVETPSLDEVEMEEAGILFDDPDTIALLPGGMDDPDGVMTPPDHRPIDEAGWDLADAVEPED
jgi:hypothetical protein